MPLFSFYHIRKGMDMDYIWNPWHGCRKVSEGCRHCYVYRMDEKHGRDASAVTKNADIDLPLRKGRGGYKIPSGSTVYTCFSSDFLLEEADEWRDEAWRMMRERGDLRFLFITKRIDRFLDCIPSDWGEGYPNVTIGCTCENQKMAEYRLPYFCKAPIAHKFVVCEPLLEPIDFRGLLSHEDRIEEISVGGESGNEARLCDYAWILDIRDFCASEAISFHFHQTGAKFKKDGRIYAIPRKFQHVQAKRAGIDLP